MDLKKDGDLFQAVWKFFKKYNEAEMTQEYWNEVLLVGKSIQKEYDSELATDLVVSVINELERRVKQ